MLAVAALCVAAFFALLGLAYGVGPAMRLDAQAFDGFAAVGEHAGVWYRANDLAQLFNPAPFAAVALALIVLAALTRGLRIAAAAGLLLAGANVSSQVLKPALAHPRDLSGWSHLHDINPAAFPS